ncbi:hypothetical protein HBH53_041310 [Parastagonospora nodorum]|nr:hypothetical protein HBH53_041310 [Parastagonospora nodorum]KAH4223775.1 hypothetical protein HBI06_130090 [Parastagonospora nodorum]KAH4241240.1 hypothetical protein HBI05_093930 [Parastagonospora nodorum]KAH4812710.1 hypothetical protein HBH61_079420 [Parastagonospora nodorum]KAH5028232.1 hypothetical protein HBI74_118270 [Parastagonospora nodorum]
MSSKALDRARNRSVKTCTQCKQVKLRCDSRDRFPAPCTRCQTRDLQCVIDSAFRRTPARKRIEEMAKELEALKTSRHDAVHSHTESPNELDTTQDSPDHPLNLTGTATLDLSGLERNDYELDDCVINSDTVIEIFQLFCVHFYPHLPILNPTISISSLYDLSPILFWTIVAITTARPIIASYESIIATLREPFVHYFRNEILDAPLPLQTIQAITYLTMFPLTLESQTEDPSWLYSGVAVNAAMYMGLHRAKPAPSLRSIGVYAGSPRARAHTWLGCFVASTSLAKHVGVTAPIKSLTDLAAIEYMLRTYPLPPEFAYEVMVHHTLAKFFSIIVENSEENVSHSLIGIIDAELDSLRTRFPTPWTTRTEMAYLTAKILLYTTVILRLQSDRSAREILMRKALTVAVRIAYLTNQGLAYRSTEFPNLRPQDLGNTLPKNYYRTLILSTAFLIRFFVLNVNAQPEEQELARNHVALAQRYLTLSGEDPQDERVRGAILFDVLCKQAPIDLETAKLKVDDRMAASLWYDAISTGHVLRNRPVEVEEASPRAAGEDSTAGQEIGGETATQDALSYEPGVMDFGAMDFSLPEDLWGDSIWGMFDPIAPSTHPGTGEGQF